MLTNSDITRTLSDERHLGWGFACCSDMGDSKYSRLVAAVTAVANELGLDYELLFMWSNSKHGRWLADDLSSAPPTRATVRRHLSANIIAELIAHEALEV